MPNKVENTGIVDDKVYYNVNNLEGEMMRYRNNSLSYKLGMLGILLSLLGAFICFNSYTWGVEVLLKLAINIIILLFGFLAIEKVKAYSEKYSYVLIGMGVVCIARIFWIPLILMIDYAAYLKDSTVIGHLGPTITGSYLVNSYLPMNGYFRGISAMVLFACAAVAFIFAGLIGLKKSRQYAEFIATQDTTKGV